MSSIHVLDQADDHKTINLVYHFPIPALNNGVGLSYRTELVTYLGGAAAITSQVATPTELTQMQSGALLELATSYRWSKMGLNDAQKLAEMQADYNSRQATVLAALQSRLMYYGYAV